MIQSVGIIGFGKVGKVLATFLKEQKMLKWIISQSAEKSEFILRNISEIQSLPDAIILAVPDKKISEISQNLATKFGTQLKNTFIFHLSGSLYQNELRMCEQNGAITAATHPFQTFYFTDKSNNSAAEILQDVAWGIECQQEVFPEIKQFINTLLGKAFLLSSDILEKKPIYHAAAVISANYTTAAILLSKKIATLAGIEMESFLKPIINTTIKNNFSDNNFPLTGPISRCDFAIIKKHLDALSDEPQLQKSYAAFGLALVELLKIEHTLSEENIQELEKIFLLE